MTDPYQCLRCSSIAIGVYNLVFCLTQFAILGWQTQVVKQLQWSFENRQVPPSFTMNDGVQARFPGLYALYTETPERRRINAMFVIVLVSLGLCFLHFIATPLMLYGVIKRNGSFICPWFFTGFPFIMLTTAYAILWWSGDVFNEQLTMSVAEFVLSLAINGPCFIVVLMYYLRISGRLRSDKLPSQRNPHQTYSVHQRFTPADVPPWHQEWPTQPPYEIGRKIRRRERSKSPKRYPQQEQGYYPPTTNMSAYSMPATSAEFARLAQLSQRRPSARQQQSSRPGSGYPTQQQQPTYRTSSQHQPYRPTSVLKNRSRSTTPANMRRKSPQRVSFKNRPKVYERTPESSLSNGGKLEIQTVV